MPSTCLGSGSSKSLSLNATLLVGLRRGPREVLQRSLGVGLDGLASLGPVGRADLSVFVLDRKSQLEKADVQRCKSTNSKLEGLDQTNCLLDRTPHRQIVDGDLSKHRCDQKTYSDVYAKYLP